MNSAEADMILSAAMKNDIDKIWQMVRQEGVSPSYANGVGQTVLHIAALWGHTQAVAILLQLGADVQATNHISGGTPLHMVLQANKAPLSKQEAVVDLLLRYNADINKMDNFGNLPVDYLLQHHQSISKEHPFAKKLATTNSPILTLVEKGEVDQLLNYLLSMDQDSAQAICNKSYSGKTAFTMALDRFFDACESDNEAQSGKKIEYMKQSWDILHAIAKAGGCQPEEDEEDPPLLRVMACLFEMYENDGANAKAQIGILQEAAQRLQEMSGADGLERGKSRILHDSARRGHLDLLRFACLELKWDVNGTNRQGMTAMQFAARSGKLQALQSLLNELGADPSHKDSMGQTALDAAAKNKKEDCVEFLRAFEFMGTLATTKFQSPTSVEEVGQLLSYLSLMDPDSARAICNTSYQGKTAFTMALDGFFDACESDNEAKSGQKIESMKQSWDILHAIAKAGGRQPEEDEEDPPLLRVMTCLFEMYENDGAENANAEIGILQEAARSLQEVSKVDGLERGKSRILHDSARRGHLDLLRFACLELKWDVNGTNRQGMTAMQFAARSGKLQALQLLLNELGADPSHKDSMGQTALDAAAKNKKEDCVEFLRAFE